MTTVDAAFRETQARFWDRADEAHFRWQVDGGYFTETERSLIAAVSEGASARFLEVGCGEGGNLVNLLPRLRDRAGLIVGMDLFVSKLVFARQAVPFARYAAADALRLPFRDSSFDAVLCRDVLHHVEDRDAALRELSRVTRPGGTIWIVEPNGRNPLIAAFAMALAHERGQLQTTPARLRGLVERHIGPADLRMHQPLPIERAVLHYRFGLPRLGASRTMARLLGAWTAVTRLLPRPSWAYIVIRATRTAS